MYLSIKKCSGVTPKTDLFWGISRFAGLNFRIISLFARCTSYNLLDKMFSWTISLKLQVFHLVQMRKPHENRFIVLLVCVAICLPITLNYQMYSWVNGEGENSNSSLAHWSPGLRLVATKSFLKNYNGSQSAAVHDHFLFQVYQLKFQRPLEL